MSKLFYKAVIEDIRQEGCASDEIEILLDIFEHTVKKMATTLARKSWYKLSDFATPKLYELEDFTLTIERCFVLQLEQWWGHFECGKKSLKVIATLEKN